ncbi:MAG: class I SAM-dependent methyltransferase [Anaerolineae bacterium]|nr:class I SAM-dependent methyltransferase [Anaerolineae bacterium]
MDYAPLAGGYARHRRPHPEVLRALEQRVKDSGAVRVLEVGCGAGAYVEALALSTRARPMGLDPSRQMLSQWSECPRSERVQARAEAIPLSAASVDLVFTVDVIHHLSDPDAYFRDAHRVLRSGGWVCTVTDSEDIIRSRRPLSAYFPETIAIELARYPALSRLRALMRAAGFRDLQEGEVGVSYPMTDIGPYRDRAYSALHLIGDEAFGRGLVRLAADLGRGPVQATSRYAMLWGRSRCWE